MVKISESKQKKSKVFLDTNLDKTRSMKLTNYEWG